MVDDCDYFAENVVSSDTLEYEVIEKEVVKVKIETEKRMYCYEIIHLYINLCSFIGFEVYCK